MPTLRSYRTTDLAARAWAKPLQISGTSAGWLVIKDEGRALPYKPVFSGHRQVQGFRQLGTYLLREGEIVSVSSGYQLRRDIAAAAAVPYLK
jgi:hypothetical protein